MFELHITCTKDIDKIQIDFSDGSVCTSKRADSKDLVEPPKPPKPVEPKNNKPKKSVDKVNSRDIIQTYDDGGDSEVTGVVVKPSVPDAPTEPKVEDYLQELNF